MKNNAANVLVLRLDVSVDVETAALLLLANPVVLELAKSISIESLIDQACPDGRSDDLAALSIRKELKSGEPFAMPESGCRTFLQKYSEVIFDEWNQFNNPAETLKKLFPNNTFSFEKNWEKPWGGNSDGEPITWDNNGLVFCQNLGQGYTLVVT